MRKALHRLRTGTFRDPYNLTEPYSIFPPLQQTPIDSVIDDRTTHELYLWSFAEAVRAGTGTIMCSYNEVNSTHACQDDFSLNYLLKEELNFQGAVISDWGGTWTNQESALGGWTSRCPERRTTEGSATFTARHFSLQCRMGRCRNLDWTIWCFVSSPQPLSCRMTRTPALV